LKDRYWRKADVAKRPLLTQSGHSTAGSLNRTGLTLVAAYTLAPLRHRFPFLCALDDLLTFAAPKFPSNSATRFSSNRASSSKQTLNSAIILASKDNIGV